MFLTLARRLTNQTPNDGQSLEALFAQGRTAEAEAEGFLVEGTWQSESGTGTALPSAQFHPSGEIADLWGGAFADQSLPVTALAPAAVPSPQGRVVSLEELAQLVRRSKPRRKAVPTEQLPLFSGLGR